MGYANQFLAIGAISLLAVISPGPDFLMISRNSLVCSRLAGLFSALGLSTGILVHVGCSILGISLFLAKTPFLLTAVRYLGATYLVYLGWQALNAKEAQAHVPASEIPQFDRWGAFRMGFLTNVLNPKATLFIFSLFTQVVSPHTPLDIQVLYGIEISCVTLVWFSFVALMLSNSVVKAWVSSCQILVEKVFGVALVSVGMMLFL